MKIRRVEYLNSLPFHKQIIETLKVALNFKIKIKDFKKYLEEETEAKKWKE